MPEIAEIARIVHYIKKYLAGKTITNVLANEDAIVFKDTTHAAFMKAMKGKKIVDARQQGKYFWMVMDSPPHPLMHFGMTGWITFSQAPEAHYRADMADEDTKEEVVWPPRFLKFELEVDDDGNRVAFTDPRRLGRVRLIDTPADNIRKVSPLKENGPDPVVDGLDEKWFSQTLLKRKVPVKALLLDQAFISGVGNWVGDEILFHARIHPEQYTNTLSEAQQKQLYESTLHICTTACDLLGDSSKFPSDWLFKYRWGKGKKGNQLPSGEKIDFVKVGGRTSAYVKTRQKATGGTAVKSEAGADDGGAEKKSAKKRKAVKAEEEEEEEDEEEEEEEEYTPAKRGRRSAKVVKAEVPTPAKRGRRSVKKEESDEEEPEPVVTKSARRERPSKKDQEEEPVATGKTDRGVSSGRRSGRPKK
ncbi:Formamidopyrimidine-DNA glycosylase [Drechslerella dactyloides]|uniref:Formamidopyrimidine-DNA glycosylase n=1 Tax=Drechslerella dactyloides TaxID=74499 RepID=A0AAD6NI18_DREDA|nr:Formamidopyrimidine-DNA glycosylase [Drechslerella dactyloides]